MASIYSVRFLAVAALGGTEEITNGTGNTWIVRDIDVFMGSQVLGAVVYFQGPAFQNFFWCQTDPLTALWVPWRGRQVILPGETIAVSVTTGNADVTISGYSLTPP